jgi:hypothetical protein
MCFVLAMLLLGLAAVGLMTAMIVLVRHVERLAQHVHHIEVQTAVYAEQNTARTHADSMAARLIANTDEWRSLLADIREALLLSDEERARRFDELVQKEIQAGVAQVEQLIAFRDFQGAREVLTTLLGRFGQDDRLCQTQGRLEQAMDAARKEDIARAKARMGECMGLGRWDEAEHIARELGQRYPQEVDGPGLIEQIRHERDSVQQQQRQRMRDEIQQLVRQRRWSAAAEATRVYLNLFPTGSESDILRDQLQTLEANADIQARQSLEKQIRHHIEHRRYAEALALANRIIMEHPTSPQAEALRSQIPRLEKCAREQPSA